ncbi:hypothetical protein [Mucisphaera calidilacus]|uniref:Uncharacterized protein n=1 Tax=Mucisphaera calidilacus TaxID=2527982 RepID=A0A518C0R1_9BACT|nr:hypothetical protein [Mucisphaera calidilacus]QDU72806.1 hypothetical protein Pan265_26800 [Mucisphaera calidilacus]
MNFSEDRDLLAYEPEVFSEVPFAAQERVSIADGVVTGSVLSSVSADFVAAGVSAGCVVLLDRVAHEVVEVLDGQSLRVSRLRVRASDALVSAAEGEGVAVRVRTFAAQASLVHDLLLRLLGLEGEDGLGEGSVVSLGAVCRLECLGALELIYSAAASVGGANESVLAKSALYRGRFRRACRETTVGVDVDGDGLADERRGLGLVSLVRA